MSDVVLDASVIIAAVLQEPGGDRAVGHSAAPLVSAVNYAEVRSKLVDVGLSHGAAEDALELLRVEIVPFDKHSADDVAGLREATRAAGLSLGDRACLALAMSRKARAVTADRAWERAGLPVDIEFVR